MIQNNQSIMRKNVVAEELPHSMVSILESKLKILCDICNLQVTQPKICPSCNEIFCLSCLTKYHEAYKNCPMCHEKFAIAQFLDCDCHKFIEYFRYELGKLQYTQKTGNNKRIPFHLHPLNIKEIEQQQKCVLHQIPLKYFCETCTKPICSDCGMMTEQHKDHKFTRINDIYTKIKQKLNSQLANLSKKITTYQQHSLLTKKKLQKLQIQYMHIKRYTQQYYLLLVEKFEQEIDAKSMCLKEIQEKNIKDVEFYELCRDGICEEIERKAKNQLIGETEKILSSFTINSCQPCEPLKIEQSFETIKQLMPDYNNFEYTLRNFSQQVSSIVYSDPFTINGVEWRLKIYPKGNGVAKNKHLSVFVEMSKAEKNQKKYQYKIELINSETSAQNIRREYCSAFDIGECWGYNQFVLLQELQHGFMVGDSLHFIMGIRNSDYRSLSQDQSNYIARLQASIKQRQQQRQNQIQETNIIDDLNNLSYSNHNNQTKFLKFLQSSVSVHQSQKVSQNKIKEKSDQKKVQQKRQRQKQDKRPLKKEEQKFSKKQQEKVQNNKCFSQKKSQEKTTNNLQRNYIKALGEKKSLQNQFLLTEEGFLSSELKFTQSEQQKIKSKDEDIHRIKKKKSSQQEKIESKQKIHQPSGNKFISLKELKSEKFSSNNESKSSILVEVKPQKKERQKTFLPKQEEHEERNYIPFTESKKHLKKQETNNFDFESSKRIKKQAKDTKNLTDFCPYKKIEQSKASIQSEQIVKTYQKYEESRDRINMKMSKNSENSPSQIKDFIDENETRKKQISSILQQSKKLQGIKEVGIKQSGSAQLVLKSPIKSQLKFQQKEQKRKSEKKFEEDDEC